MSDIGYGKPPKAHRFKPGVSGNPRGRPRGARGFKSELADALAQTVLIKEKGTSRHITVGAAALRRLIQKAVVDGNLGAIDRLLGYAQQNEASLPPPLTNLDRDDQALLADFLRRQGGNKGDE